MAKKASSKPAVNFAKPLLVIIKVGFRLTGQVWELAMPTLTWLFNIKVPNSGVFEFGRWRKPLRSQLAVVVCKK
jgi:hypothetical protein